MAAVGQHYCGKTMINFFHNYLPQPVLVDLGFVKIYYYGLIFVSALIIGYFLLKKLAKIKNLPGKHLDNLIFYLFIFGLAGARIYHVLFYNFQYFSLKPWEIFYFWHGGIAIQGAIIGSLITLYFYCKKHQLNFWQYSDVLVIPLILGQAIGRWGNYFNQEVYGQPTELLWGIPITYQNRVAGFESFDYFQPIFFYEFVFNLILFFILIWLFYKKKLAVGFLTLFYLIGYSLIRFFMEFLRIEPVTIILGVRFPHVVSGLIIIFSLFILNRKIQRTTN